MIERGVINMRVTRGSTGVDDENMLSKEDGELGDLAMPKHLVKAHILISSSKPFKESRS